MNDAMNDYAHLYGAPHSVEQTLLDHEHMLWMASRQMNAYRAPAQRTHDEKLAAAKAFLGERWVLHPVNHVRRAPVFLGVLHA